MPEMRPEPEAVTNPTRNVLRDRLVAAKLAGSAKLSGPVDRDDPVYRFRSNEQAADAALAAFGEYMDALAIVEPATTWEAAYKQLRREVGGASS